MCACACVDACVHINYIPAQVPFYVQVYFKTNRDKALNLLVYYYCNVGTMALRFRSRFGSVNKLWLRCERIVYGYTVLHPTPST